jgi:hypothetical protein
VQVTGAASSAVPQSAGDTPAAGTVQYQQHNSHNGQDRGGNKEECEGLDRKTADQQHDGEGKQDQRQLFHKPHRPYYMSNPWSGCPMRPGRYGQLPAQGQAAVSAVCFTAYAGAVTWNTVQWSLFCPCAGSGGTGLRYVRNCSPTTSDTYSNCAGRIWAGREHGKRDFSGQAFDHDHAEGLATEWDSEGPRQAFFPAVAVSGPSESAIMDQVNAFHRQDLVPPYAGGARPDYKPKRKELLGFQAVACTVASKSPRRQNPRHAEASYPTVGLNHD